MEKENIKDKQNESSSIYFSEEALAKDFARKYEEEVKKIPRPVVLICGFTGSGKSTVLQEIFGKKVVSDDKIGTTTSKPLTQKYDEYKNQYIKIYDSKGLEPGKGEDNFIEETREFISGLRDLPNLNDHIHVYWYVIQGSGARVTDTDLKIINTFPKESTVVIISKKDITKEKQLKAIKERLTNSGILNHRIIPISERQDEEEVGEGIENLCYITEEIMPEAYKVAWNEAQRVNARKAEVAQDEAQRIRKKVIKVIKDKKNEANTIIVIATTASGLAGAIPIPFSDTFTITPIQLGMIARLAALYKINIQKEQVLPMLTSIAGKQAVVSLLKFIPVTGSVVSATTAVTITGGIGLFAQNQFEKIAIATVKGEEPPSLIFDSSMVLDFIKKNKDMIKDLTKKQ